MKTTLINTTENLLEDILDASLNGIVVYKALRGPNGEIFDFEFELVNRIAAQVMRRPASEFIGKRLNDLFPSREKGGHHVFVEVTETGKPRFWENHFQHEDFDNYFEVSVVRFRDGVLVTFNDITERRRSAEKARALERLDLIVNNLPALVSYIGSDYRYQFLNDTYEAWFGEQARHWVGKSLADVLGEEGFSRIKPKIDLALAGKPATFVIPMPFQNSGNRFIRIEYLPDLDEAGTVRGLFALINDISEDIRTHKELEENAERFRSLIDTIPAIAFTALPDGNFSYANKAWVDFFREEDPNQWAKYMITDELNQTAENWVRALSAGEPFEGEAQWRSWNGEIHWLLTRIKPMHDKEGNIVLWIGVSTDITAQKKSYEDLERKNEELNKLNARLDELLFTAFHDLKSPVVSIEGLIDLMNEVTAAETVANPDYQSVRSLIKESIAKFKQTIFDLSNQEIKRAAARDVEEVDLMDLIEEIRLGLWQEISSSRAMFRVDTVSCPSFHFSRKNLRSIIYNLLSNALKYRSPERPPLIRITSTHHSGGQGLVLTIKDNGIGIDEQDQQTIFSMFKRIHQYVEGSGLGLYIVRRIVENAGGHIEVESELGKGSTFKVVLPAQEKN